VHERFCAFASYFKLFMLRRLADLGWCNLGWWISTQHTLLWIAMLSWNISPSHVRYDAFSPACSCVHAHLETVFHWPIKDTVVLIVSCRFGSCVTGRTQLCWLSLVDVAPMWLVGHSCVDCLLSIWFLSDW